MAYYKDIQKASKRTSKGVLNMPKPNPQKFMSPQYEDYRTVGGVLTLWLLYEVITILLCVRYCLKAFSHGNFSFRSIALAVFIVLASIALFLLSRRKYSFRIVFCTAALIYFSAWLPWDDLQMFLSGTFPPLLCACYTLFSARVAVYCGRF